MLPLIIAHRGASGWRPEHTLAAYALAIDQGADYVEPDLVMTQDGVPVARHENEIGSTTDVADHAGFAGRRTTKRIDGVAVSGWFSEDFTLAALKTLRTRARLPELRPDNAAYDGRYDIPTLQEIIALVKRKERETGRAIGLYPETKHPSYFRSIGLPLEQALVDILHDNGYRGPRAPVFIQSFEVANLQALATVTEIPLIQLIDAGGRPYDFVAGGDSRGYADLITPAGLVEIATYVQGIGPDKSLIVPRDARQCLLPLTTLVDDAHRLGLRVHPWTFRSENFFLPADFRRGDPGDPAYLRQHGDAEAEYHLFFALGVDGLFSDFPGVAVRVRDSLAV